MSTNRAMPEALNVITTHTDQIIALVWANVSAAELQSRLFDLGYYDGHVDGEPRAETFAALARFQHDHGLRVTGQPDPRTMQALREAYCY